MPIFRSANRIRYTLSLATLCALSLSSCSTTEEEFEKLSVEELYTQAKTSFDNGSYNKAAETFAEVERQHPYSEWALQAQLMSAYSYYEAKKYIEAIEGFNVFIQLHPGHDSIPYAYYMLGLCEYEQIPTVHRDQEYTKRSLRAFEEVIRRFPESPYARDSKYKIDLIKDHLAGKEMEVGRYYLNNKAYLAAVNRFKVVVEQYQTTSHIPEALHRMVECYLALGIPEQAHISAALLGHNFPGSPWYADTYALMTTQKAEKDLPQKQALKEDLKKSEPIAKPAKTPPKIK